MGIGLREVESNYAGDSGEVLSAVIIIAQSDMKYLMKLNMEQSFYESGHGGMTGTLFTTSIVRYFSEILVFNHDSFLEKTSFYIKPSFFKLLLTFITFVNYERAYLVKGLFHILCSCFSFRNINKKEKK